MYFDEEVTGLLELSIKLKQLPDQVMGVPCAVSDAGQPYVEFFEYALCRPHDVRVIDSVVATSMWRKLKAYFEGRSGRIYWRMPFEHDVNEYHVVARFDENGPDRDIVTDRKCLMDKNWRIVKCYCRLYRAPFPVPAKEAA